MDSAATLHAALVATALVVLALSPTVAAPGDGGALGFTSSVTRVVPASGEIDVRVLDVDDRVEISDRSGKELVRERVYRNERSPGAYLNDPSTTHPRRRAIRPSCWPASERRSS